MAHTEKKGKKLLKKHNIVTITKNVDIHETSSLIAHTKMQITQIDRKINSQLEDIDRMEKTKKDLQANLIDLEKKFKEMLVPYVHE